ncbi:calcium/sodium antiporter [Inediibacterium massiliense]|uniref:calcium/sodium antiporter n=1 Tax=Inediibacterium massiliense TaxID=1658111 RepID=UPI0006B4CAF7|nr:calcium/sodium antiporter [Inediibacterium massiliense]
MTYILLLLGFVFLIKGADYFVDAASNVAKILRISPIVIGLTIVAFGTSSPEAAVSIKAALNQNSGISLGNVVGSNMINMTFILGITAMIRPLTVAKETIRKEIPFTLLSSILLLVLMMDQRFQMNIKNQLTRGDGLVLLSFFIIFLYYILEVAANSLEKNEAEEDIQIGSMKKNIFIGLGGLGAIILGGEFVVRSSTKIAIDLGLSETLVGLTIAAIGTSLPEMITSITAAIKKQSDIAVGNIIGSNIFNIVFILGASSTVSTMAIDSTIFTDVILMIVGTILLFIFSKTQYELSRKEGFVLFASYIAYVVYIIIRN